MDAAVQKAAVVAHEAGFAEPHSEAKEHADKRPSVPARPSSPAPEVFCTMVQR